MENKENRETVQPSRSRFFGSLRIPLAISLSVNLFLLLALIVVAFQFVRVPILDGVPETFDGRMGVLTEDIEVGPFDTSDVLFRLPKGLPVRNAQAFGMDRFEPYRFRIVVTTEREDLVDYSNEQLQAEASEFYSADGVDR